MKIKQRKVKDGEIIIVDDTLEVGDGVTLIYYSDEVPATVIEIDPKGRWIKVQNDKATRIDNNGMSDCQDYRFERDTNGRVHTFYKTRKQEYTLFTNTGRFTYDNYGIWLMLKVRRKYYDYSF